MTAGHGRCWMTRLQRYARVRSSGFGARFGTSWRSAGTKKPAMMTTSASGRANDERGEPEAHADEADRHERGGDDAPPAGDLDAVLGEAEQGRQQRDRGDHRGQHGEGGADGQAGHEGQAHDEHAAQRDHHGGAGEEHGPARGVDGLGGGLLGREARCGGPPGSG